MLPKSPPSKPLSWPLCKTAGPQKPARLRRVHRRGALLAARRLEEEELERLRREALDLVVRVLRRALGDLRQRVVLLLAEALRGVALQLRDGVADVLREEGVVREERRGAERLRPVLGPKRLQDLRVERRAEALDLEGVVLGGVHAEVLDLVQGDREAAALRALRRRVVGRVGAEGSDRHAARRAGARRVNDHGDE